jgi:argininosuccinate synthase
MKKVVLAFSGGLDTSFCAIYLSKIKNLEVHAVTINTGGFNKEELAAIKEKAIRLGVKSFVAIDETDNYYNKCIKYLVFGNVLKNNTYPLSVSAERICQATAIAEYAKSINGDFVAHGSTGAGNDQVRFDMIFQILIPEIEIISPVRDLKLSRQKEIDFLKEHGVHMDFQKAVYSINKGLWGTSVGGKETLTSNLSLPEEAYPSQLTKKNTKSIALIFEKGELIGINDKKFESPVHAIQALQTIAEPYAIGRDTHVGDTIIGIKGRVSFEAAAPIIIIKAHHTLEKHVLTKYQLMIKDQLAIWYGNWLHEGFFLDAVMRNIEAFFSESQQNVTGKIYIDLKPYQFIVTGIESENDLMSSKFGSYGEMNNTWSGEDVKGFSKIFGNAMSIYHKVNQPS